MQFILCRGKPDTVGNTENVRIHGNGRYIERDRRYYIGGFPPDAGQTLQRLPIMRHLSAVFVNQRP